jgi:signal transduction histidine kinase
MQVLINLLANAFKYTPDEGKILMRATKEKKDLLVEVVDSGPGIPETDLPFLFERFYKANKGRGDGSGLGLSIAKSFIEAHHRKISAANRPEGGSVFTFTMPSISGNVPLE